MYTYTTTAFSRNYLLQFLIAAYAVYWIALAFHPTNRGQWLMENLIPIATIAFLGWTYRKFQLSNLSYVLLFIFLCLHTYAAHFTYQNTPVDMWLKSAIHTKRSYFDRVVHFAFGLLLAYPLREAMIRIAGIRGKWTYIISAAVILTFSAIFEIIEAIVAILAGSFGAQYIGLQGDMFDSEKDMVMGFAGAIIAMGFLAFLHKRQKKA
ncbi:DUF2238 domain-containing protein [Paenibacillus allorhizosphaerae]|uniref:Inner membrane protein YjdF n=1 Tax=Paenibacillus allorhizosphaerae TaxID=2849866 RepID=A0ABM8VPA7_9BACL|nr:DUF2238 domain-containing protein [Paenibacillus allorhizosphaerae]CAG7652344.1 Inner membrane protein YjdF [Paenibacillus allorhizosphaerae]